MKSALAPGLDRGLVLERWFKSIAETYPKITATFLARESDRFGNPVGHSISAAIGPIYDQVVSDMDESALRGALDGIIRVRAVQDFSASEAVGFVFALKSAVRASLGGGAPTPGTLEEIDARIDRVALMAFDTYSECRERLHDIRANEIRARSFRLLERVGASPVALGHESEDIEEKAE
jgi:hypothetical protein